MEPKRLEYEPAHRKLSGLKWIVVVFLVVGSLLAVAILFGTASRVTFTATGTLGPVAAVTPATRPAPLTLETDPASFTLKQRTWMQLSSGHMIGLGDITRREVLVTVTTAAGATVFSRLMKESEAASFVYAGQTVHVKLAKLTTRLTSDDMATLELSATRPVSEAEKIDALIAHIEGLEGASFYRNGDWHPATDAAAHLRRKRDYVGDKITTADQFITELASKSSQSGEAYKIKLKDGTETPAGDYLRSKLPEIEQQLRSAP